MTAPLSMEARWQWLPHEAQYHINWKELAAVQMMLEPFDLEVPGLVWNSFLLNRSDNTVACSYVNKMGGRIPVLSFIAEQLWYWLLERGSEIRLQYLPGEQNVDADTASRWLVDRAEFRLRPALFQSLDQRWGPFTVDAFASRLNRQMTPFWSRYADPDAAARDAFLQSWSGHNLFLAPPFVLLAKVLMEVQRRQAFGTLVVPLWPTQSWWSSLMIMALDFEVLGLAFQVLHHPSRKTITSRDRRERSFPVVAFRLSGRTCNSKDTQMQLSRELFSAGSKARATAP